MSLEVSLPMLAPLFSEGFARVPLTPGVGGAEAVGLVRREASAIGPSPVIAATPSLLRLAHGLPSLGEQVACVVACEPRFREAWLDLEAARLADLGRRGAISELCAAIAQVSPAARALTARLGSARLSATAHAGLELELFGGAADQPMAAQPLRRVLGATAALVEGGVGRVAPSLVPIHARDTARNWVPGRLIQAPVATAAMSEAPLLPVLDGRVCALGEGLDRTSWVLGTPWLALLTVVVFTAEAWAAERRGGLQLELPQEHVASFGAPPRVRVVVLLPDGREAVCGSLGELCLRTLDALQMAVVPYLDPTSSADAARLDQALASVIAILLRVGVWAWVPDARPRYVIGDAMSYDCYRGEGHRYICRGAEHLSQTLRGVATAWARARLGQAEAA